MCNQDFNKEWCKDESFSTKCTRSVSMQGNVFKEFLKWIDTYSKIVNYTTNILCMGCTVCMYSCLS